MEWKVYGEPTENKKKFELLVNDNRDIIANFFLPIAKRKVFDTEALKMAYNAGQAELAKSILSIIEKGEQE